MSIGEQIQAARLERGLSLEQTSLAVAAARVKDERGRYLSMNASALSRIERGQKFPALRTMQALALVLQVEFVVHANGIEVVTPA